MEGVRHCCASAGAGDLYLDRSGAERSPEKRRSDCCVHAKVAAGCEAGPLHSSYTPARASVSHYGYKNEQGHVAS